jgi:hypothetical protein
MKLIAAVRNEGAGTLALGVAQDNLPVLPKN